MVPSAFVALEALPLTANGKVDRKALPAPEGGARGGRHGYVAPRDDVEQRLCDIWAQVLGVKQVGIHDNFFELGGDSIISLQVVARARQAGLVLATRQLFQHQTVERLAQVVKSATGSRGEQGPVTGPVPLTPIQLQLAGTRAGPRPPLQPVRAPGLARAAGAHPLEKALQHLLSHHDALRLRFRHARGHLAPGERRVPGRRPSTCTRWTSPPRPPPSSPEPSKPRPRASRRASCSRRPRCCAPRSSNSAGGQQRLLLVGPPPRRGRRLLARAARGPRVRLPQLQHRHAAREDDLVPVVGPPSPGPCPLRGRPGRGAPVARRGARAGGAAAHRRLGSATPTPPSAPSPCRLDAEETRLLLQEVPSAWRAHINDVLLTALAEALGEWTGQSRVLVDLEGHGREELFDGRGPLAHRGLVHLPHPRAAARARGRLSG